MITRQTQLFKIFGFTVSLDLSWFFILVLITWSLATGFFPSRYTSLSTPTYWIMGIAGALGLFMSIILHEMSHSIVARRYGIPIRGITLFLFGGVAQMEDEPPSPQAEFSMAVAGPIMSILIALLCLGLSRLFYNTGIPVAIYGVLRYLAFINGALALFNIIPAFPLDGGRILRSIIWKTKNNLKSATYIASRIGSIFGFVLIGVGVVSVLTGSFVGGMWWFLIGLFLNNAARSSYRQLLMRTIFMGEKVSRFMKTDIVTVSPKISVQELVDDYVYRYHYKMFPVLEDGELRGCVTTQLLKKIPRSEWENRTVGELAEQCSQENSVSLDMDALKMLGIMNRTGRSRLMVVEGKKLVGVITLKDMLQFMSLKVELEEDTLS